MGYADSVFLSRFSSPDGWGRSPTPLHTLLCPSPLHFFAGDTLVILVIYRSKTAAFPCDFLGILPVSERIGTRFLPREKSFVRAHHGLGVRPGTGQLRVYVSRTSALDPPTFSVASRSYPSLSG